MDIAFLKRINESRNTNIFLVMWIVCISNKQIRRNLLHKQRMGTLCMRLLLLSTEQSKERSLGDTYHLETDSRNITHSVTGTTESSNQDFIILIHKVQTTITRNESSDFLSVLDQLNTDALTNGRVRLFSLYSTIHKPTNPVPTPSQERFP